MEQDPTGMQNKPANSETAKSFVESDYLEKKYGEIKKASENNDFVEVLKRIEEVEKYKLDCVAEKESKEGKNFKILGRGLEYTVYDLGNGRVKKRHNSMQEQDDVLRSWVITDEKKREKIVETINALTEASMSMVKTLLDQEKIQAETLGNPLFEEGTQNYTQDKVMPVASYIKEHALEENKQVIEKYISLTHALWRSGVSDATFKFIENNGVSESGEVVQLDFGEFAFTKEKVLSLIEGQKWLKQNYRFIGEGVLKEYVKQRFSEAFTVEKLNELWIEPRVLDEERQQWKERSVAYSESWG